MKNKLLLKALQIEKLHLANKISIEQVDNFFLNENERLISSFDSDAVTRYEAKRRASLDVAESLRVGDTVITGFFNLDDYSECGGIDPDHQRWIGKVVNFSNNNTRVGVSQYEPLCDVDVSGMREYNFPPLYVRKLTPDVIQKLGLNFLPTSEQTYYNEAKDRKANFSVSISESYNSGFTPDNEDEDFPASLNVGCQRVPLVSAIQFAIIAQEIMVERGIPLLTYEEMAYVAKNKMINYSEMRVNVNTFDKLKAWVENVKVLYARDREDFIKQMSAYNLSQPPKEETTAEAEQHLKEVTEAPASETTAEAEERVRQMIDED